jgi:hypothetical protein
VTDGVVKKSSSTKKSNTVAAETQDQEVTLEMTENSTSSRKNTNLVFKTAWLLASLK